MPESILVRQSFRLEPWGKTVVQLDRPEGAMLNLHTKGCFFLHPVTLRKVVRLIRVHLQDRNLYVVTLENSSAQLVTGEFGAQFTKQGKS